MQRCDDPFEPGLAAAVGRDTTGFVCSVGSRTVVSFRVGCFVSAGVVGGGDVVGGEVCVAGVEGFVDGGVAYVDRSS